MRIHAAHAMFIHCTCHRLQLASVQAAENVTEIKQISARWGIFLKLFNYSPKKAEKLKEVHSIHLN